MRSSLILVLVFLFSFCVENKNESKFKMKKVETIPFTAWKNSLKNIKKISDLEKEDLQSILNKFKKEDFERLTNNSYLEDKDGSFFVLIFLEGEVVEISLNYFTFNKKLFKRSSLKEEYGKLIFSTVTTDETLSYSDFVPNLKNRFIYPGFLILTKITDVNELTSSVSEIPESIGKYLP